MKRKEFNEILEKRALLTDGAMGTEIYKHGIFINQCYERLNLDKPELIKEIHRGYIEAGADICETNTYNANRINLSLYNLEEKVKEINVSAVRILKDLKRETNGSFLIAGGIGPTGVFSGDIAKIDKEKVADTFYEQAKYLMEAGVDLFFLETFNSMEEICLAIRAIKKLPLELPIIAMMTFPNKNETIFGKTVKAVTLRLSKEDIDVVGVNCSTGPQRALDLLKTVVKYTDKKIIIMPNAGYPQKKNNRTIYMSNAELFGNYAVKYLENGANIIGGCCGTDDGYIKQMNKSLRQIFPVKKKLDIKKFELNEVTTLPLIPLKDRSKIGSMLKNKFILSMEVLSPKGLDLDKTISIVNTFKDKFHAVNIPDGPRASARMGISTTSYFIEQKCKIETITHYCCRDRNILGIQSELLAMHALGLRNILAITGDPPKLGNYPDATAVFDIDSIGLVKVISNLNKGLDIVGNEIGGQTSFVIGVGVNPSSDNEEREIDRLSQKVAAGAEFIMTQPVYDYEQFITFYNKIKHFNIPIILGVAPLISFKSAEFQNNEIPGMSVPDRVLTMLENAKDKYNARKIGVDLSVELINKVQNFIDGIYFMTQGKISRKCALDIINKIQISHFSSRLVDAH